jgi:hypothetical protein
MFRGWGIRSDPWRRFELPGMASVSNSPVASLHLIMNSQRSRAAAGFRVRP